MSAPNPWSSSSCTRPLSIPFKFYKPHWILREKLLRASNTSTTFLLGAESVRIEQAVHRNRRAPDHMLMNSQAPHTNLGCYFFSLAMGEELANGTALKACDD